MQKKLHNEDEVTIKATGVILAVVSTTIKEKTVTIFCDDGNEYHYKEIK